MTSTESKRRENRNLLPRTYEQFIANRKKPTVGTITTLDRTKNKISARRQQLHDFQPIEFPQDKNNSKPTEQQQLQEEVPELNIQQKLIYSDYTKVREELSDSKFDSLKQKIDESLAKAKLQVLIQPLDMHKLTNDLNILSVDSLKQLEKQFTLVKNERNYPLIDSILSKNKFFLIFNRDKRYKIYQKSELLKFAKNEEIYKQGTSANDLFVIIRGSVHIKETVQTSYNEKMVVQFVSLYEGSHFGQTNLGLDSTAREEQLRQNTTVTNTQTYLLKMKHQFYRQLITNSIEDDFEKKLLLVSSLDILRQQTKLFITPLVSGLTRTKYKYGQVVIRKGDILNKLYILAEGQLQVLLQQRDRRKISVAGQTREKNFIYKQFSREKRVKTANAFAKTFFYPSQEYQKSLLYGNKKLVGDEIEFTDHLIFKELKPATLFGGRAFLTQFYIHQKKKKFPHQPFQIESRLDVVCNCLKATVYELDQKKFVNLPDSLQNIILQGLAKSEEFDSANIQEQVLNRKKWKDYSSKLVSDILRQKKQRRAN